MAEVPPDCELVAPKVKPPAGTDPAGCVIIVAGILAVVVAPGVAVGKPNGDIVDGICAAKVS